MSSEQIQSTQFRKKMNFCTITHAHVHNLVSLYFLNSNSFLKLMEDKEELNEAVQFLHSES